jgi:hypothetical protein
LDQRNSVSQGQHGPVMYYGVVDGGSAGVVSPCVLTVGQGMIKAAIGNELTEDELQHAFSDVRHEQSVRPTIATEEFAAGAPAPNIAARPTDDHPPARGFDRK